MNKLATKTPGHEGTQRELKTLCSFVPWCLRGDLPSRRGIFICSLRFTLILLLTLVFSGPLFSQADFDEVLVNLHIKRVGDIELPAIIKDKEAYLPVRELFDFLRIKNTISRNIDSVDGYFLDPKYGFLILAKEKQIIYKSKTFNIPSADLIKTATGIYLKTNYFGQVFGLDCVFDIYNLSITLSTDIELPVLREMEQERMRKNVSLLTGNRNADTVMKNKFSWFRAGTADWAVSNLLDSKISSTRLNLGLGGMIAGGDVTVNLNYYSDQQMDANQQLYRWQYVNNDHAALRQVTLGKMFVPSLSSIFAPITGIQFTNTPTTYRKSFGTYRLSNTTEPGWMVELYINNILINYLKADAAGFFTFDVPLVYGNSIIKLRFYGPYGEEQIREQNINIPFNFLPPNQLEYTVTAGIVGDEKRSRFSRADISYGLTKQVTVGAGTEYLSDVSDGKPMPFTHVSARIGSALILSGELAPGVRSSSTLSYHLPSNLQVDINYIKYVKGQTAIRYNYLEERKASISMPFNGKYYSAFARLTYNSVVMPKTGFNSFDLLVSCMVNGISSNLQVSALYNDPKYPTIYSNLSLALRLPAGVKLSPQVEYQFTQKNFSRLRGELEKRISRRGFANLSFEKNLIYKSTITSLGIRYNFSFAQTALLVRRIGQATSSLQTARGAVIYNNKAKFLDFNNQPGIGRGGLIILPFLDLNGNGKKDTDEPKAPGVKLRVNGRRVERSKKDSTLYLKNLEAYTSYLIELDKDSFDDISWKIKNATIGISVVPNQLTIVEIPVSVMGEVSGNVYLKKNGITSGLGRISVNIYNSSSIQVAHVLSEEDGYFSYLGLPPGSYTASVDSLQLITLKLSGLPGEISFEIKRAEHGDVVDGFKFILVEAAAN